MKLVVGLGNPGRKYENTRHNAGFILVNKLVDGKSLKWRKDRKLKSNVAMYDGVIYAKPLTFMNQSGAAVSKLISYFGVELGDLVVVHDDADVKLGEFKIHKSRGSAGHKGVESIIENLGSNEFVRIRIGVGKPGDSKVDLEKWVLMKFSNGDMEIVSGVADKLVEIY